MWKFRQFCLFCVCVCVRVCVLHFHIKILISGFLLLCATPTAELWLTHGINAAVFTFNRVTRNSLWPHRSITSLAVARELREYEYESLDSDLGSVNIINSSLVIRWLNIVEKSKPRDASKPFDVHARRDKCSHFYRALVGANFHSGVLKALWFYKSSDSEPRVMS